MSERNNIKKICIAIHGLAHAGAERVAASWANYLAKQGHSVSVIVYAHSENAYDLGENVRVIPLAETRESYFKMTKVEQILRIRKTVRQECPQCIISFLPKMQISMMLATLGMRVKRIETVRNNPWIDQDVAGKRFLWDMCFLRSHKIIVQTKEQSLYFPEKLRKKCVVISNPVDSAFLNDWKVYRDEGIHRFVAVARLNKQKNYPMMIRAFARASEKEPALTLDIYGQGSGEMLQKTQTLIDSLGMGERIRLCGWRKNISEELKQYDAFLMSSDYEGMPNALAEAMATGLICLSTDCKTGPKDMIDSGKNGFLAETGNEQSFAEGIEKIMQLSLDQCAAMGTAAREKILEMCSEENTLARLNQLIESEV